MLNPKTRSLIILLTLVLSIISCECTKVDCQDLRYTVVNIDMNILENGMDAIFGPNPSISIDDIAIISETNNEIAISSNDNKLNMWLQSDQLYSIQIIGLDTFSLIGQLETVESDGCCDQFQFMEFKLDNEVVCNMNCNALIITL